jgi:hypothetical protein
LLRSLPSLFFSLALAAPLPCLAAGPLDVVLGGPDTGPTIDPMDVGANQAKGKKGKKKKKKKGKASAEPTPAPPPPDTDKDGVIDADDKCPEEAEDQDMFEDEDGCPDPDNDGDGISDTDDDCPFDAENMDGWDDEDGCPEAPSTFSPMTLEATLNDGTKLSGTIIRVIATDEDVPKSEPHEPEGFEVIINDNDELPTTWDNLRSFKAEKVNFTDAVDCYSEGVQDLGDESPMWECTLRNPTVVKLAEPTMKGTHLFLDRKMHRLDLKLDALECEGDSCEAIEKNKTLAIYPYRLIAMEKNEDEFKAVSALQKNLRAMQARQIKSAKFTPVAPAE